MVAFLPLRCRFTVLGATIDAEAALAPMRPPLDRQFGKARTLFERAESRCEAAKHGLARRSLRLSRRRLRMVNKTLRTMLARHTASAGVIDPIARTSATLGADIGALASRLACP